MASIYVGVNRRVYKTIKKNYPYARPYMIVGNLYYYKYLYMREINNDYIYITFKCSIPTNSYKYCGNDIGIRDKDILRLITAKEFNKISKKQLQTKSSKFICGMAELKEVLKNGANTSRI